jgi:hypothetical protein
MATRLASFPATLCMMLAVAGCTSAPATSPYAGQEGRAIKALSAKEASDLLAGAGMGYAKAAELNGYPGPMHVLELAAPLDLSAAQRSGVEAILREHKAEARALGAEVLRLESRLDELFAKGQASAEGIDAAVGSLAATAGRLRASHLRAHVTTTRLLTPEQVTRYVALRGYAGAHQGH